MYKKVFTALIATAVLLITQGIQAATITFTPQQVEGNPGTTIELQVVGTGFDMDADGGGFGASWDPNLLIYVGVAPDNPPWDTSAPFETDVATGRLNSVFLGSTNNAGTSFDVAKLTFTIDAGAVPGTTIPVTLSVDDFGTEWFAPGAIAYTDVDYEVGSVYVTPIPAAAWLFGSALGFLGLSRRMLGREIDRVIG